MHLPPTYHHWCSCSKSIQMIEGSAAATTVALKYTICISIVLICFEWISIKREYTNSLYSSRVQFRNFSDLIVVSGSCSPSTDSPISLFGTYFYFCKRILLQFRTMYRFFATHWANIWIMLMPINFDEMLFHLHFKRFF